MNEDFIKKILSDKSFYWHIETYDVLGDDVYYPAIDKGIYNVGMSKKTASFWEKKGGTKNRKYFNNKFGLEKKGNDRIYEGWSFVGIGPKKIGFKKYIIN